jgi:hypothetical protein
MSDKSKQPISPERLAAVTGGTTRGGTQGNDAI